MTQEKTTADQPKQSDSQTVYLSGDLAKKYDVKINTLNVACEKGFFPAYKVEGSSYWRIPDSPELHKWLEGYQWRRRSSPKNS